MTAVTGYAIHFFDTFVAELHPSCRALRAYATPAIVMLHDAHADPRLLLGHVGSHCNDDAARLVSRNRRAAAGLESERCRAADGAIELQIAAAHARCFDLEHYFIGARCGIRKLP